MSPVNLTGTQPGQTGRALRIGNPLSHPHPPAIDTVRPTTASKEHSHKRARSPDGWGGVSVMEFSRWRESQATKHRKLRTVVAIPARARGETTAGDWAGSAAERDGRWPII
jgi:hypothetical protein